MIMLLYLVWSRLCDLFLGASSLVLITTLHPDANIQSGPHLTFRIWNKSAVPIEREAQHTSLWIIGWDRAPLGRAQEKKGSHHRPSPHHSCCWKILEGAEMHMRNSEKKNTQIQMFYEIKTVESWLTKHEPFLIYQQMTSCNRSAWNLSLLDLISNHPSIGHCCLIRQGSFQM